MTVRLIGVALSVVVLAASLSVIGCGGSEPSKAEIAQQRVELTKVLSAEVMKSDRERARATQGACRSQVGRALSLLSEHPERPLIVADAKSYSAHVQEIDAELRLIPRGSLDARCLEVLRALSAAAADKNDAAENWSEYDFEFGVFFWEVLDKCARAKPDKSECDYRQLDADKELSLLRMRLGASIMRSDWQLADKKVHNARKLLDAMGTPEHASAKVPRSEQAVDGSVIGRAVALLCAGDSVPSDAVEPCQDLRDVLIHGVAEDEESDLNTALSGLVDAYQLRPNE